MAVFGICSTTNSNGVLLKITLTHTDIITKCICDKIVLLLKNFEEPGFSRNFFFPGKNFDQIFTIGNCSSGDQVQ